jgi:hypothetical protein
MAVPPDAFLLDMRGYRAVSRAVQARFKSADDAADVPYFVLLVLVTQAVSGALLAMGADASAAGQFVAAHDGELDADVLLAPGATTWWAKLLQSCLQRPTCRKAATCWLRHGARPLCKHLLQRRAPQPHDAVDKYLALLCGAPLFGSAKYRIVNHGAARTSELAVAAAAVADKPGAKASHEPLQEPSHGPPHAHGVHQDAIARYVHRVCFAGCACELLAPVLTQLHGVLAHVRAEHGAGVADVVAHALEQAAETVAPRFHDAQTSVPRSLQPLLDNMLAMTAAAGATGFDS